MPALIRFALLGLCAIAAHPVHAGTLVCNGKAPPLVEIAVEVADPVIDFNVTKDALNRKFRNIPIKDADIYHAELDAVMTGALTVGNAINLTESRSASGAEACVGFDRLRVTFRMEPRIYLASEKTHDDCMARVLLEHELKHVQIDKDILAKYQTQARESLEFAFGMPTDVMVGPVPVSLIPDVKAELNGRVQGALTGIVRQVMVERLDRQREFDSHAEYAHLSNSCPSAPPAGPLPVAPGK